MDTNFEMIRSPDRGVHSLHLHLCFKYEAAVSRWSLAGLWMLRLTLLAWYWFMFSLSYHADPWLSPTPHLNSQTPHSKR